MGLQLRSPQHQIRAAKFAHSAATVGKTPVVIGGKAVIPMDDADANIVNSFVFDSEVSGAPKATGEAWAFGTAIYWNATNGNFTTTAASAVACGYSLGAALAADTVTPLFLFKSA